VHVQVGHVESDSMGKFNVGDVVKLKSGGPPMTVVGHNDAERPPTVRVEWFPNDESVPLSASFPEDAVEPTEIN